MSSIVPFVFLLLGQGAAPDHGADPAFVPRSLRRGMTPDMAIVSFPDAPTGNGAKSTSRH